MAVALHTAQEIRSLEAALARDHALPAAVLMARAGEALLRCLRANWPEARRILVLAGSGNNGGDGYVLARLLRERTACTVDIVALAEPKAEPGRAAAHAWREQGGEVAVWPSAGALPPADLIVDALFGIGLSRPLDGPLAALVQAANAHGAPILAVDVPSGVDADSGHAEGVAIRATRTLCLLGRKRGLYTGAAVDLTGDLSFDDLGAEQVPAAHDDIASESRHVRSTARDRHGHLPSLPAAGACVLLTTDDLHDWLPRRSRSAHKGDHGDVLVIGGDSGMSGAVRLAAEAALRSGAGWTRIATRAAHAQYVAMHRAELMVQGIEDATALAPLLARADAIAAGPGMGQGPWARAMLAAACDAGKPLVLDADALNRLAATPKPLPANVVLTPHPGEAARLLGCTVAEVERDRFTAVRTLAQRRRAIVVLKGAGTLVDDGERCAVCPSGNPGMASGGMGDVLTGVIVALIAQRLKPFEAAAAGVLAHALAGDLAAAGGERGLAAGDVIAHLRTVMNP